MNHDKTTAADLVLAQQLFQEFYARCFWHWKPDLIVTEAMIPMIVKGLSEYGGRKGIQAAIQLQHTEQK